MFLIGFMLDEMSRLTAFDDHKVDFPFIDISEISQVGIQSFDILTTKTILRERSSVTDVSIYRVT